MDTEKIQKMSAKERKALMAELRRQEAEEKAAKQAEIDSYKQAVSDCVEAAFPILLELSGEMGKVKGATRDKFLKIIKSKQKMFGVKDGQQSHTFINKEGTKRITVGVYVNDNYDDTVHEGIAKVKEYILSLAKDKETKLLTETVLKLLAKDQKGNLKASRVLQLQQLADKTGDKKFLEGVRIIRDAYGPIETKTFVRAEYKEKKTGMWKSVPLGMSEV